jgi:hypothetical protein
MLSKECLANGWIVYFSHFTLYSFVTAIFFLFPVEKISLEKEYFTMLNTYID